MTHQTQTSGALATRNQGGSGRSDLESLAEQAAGAASFLKLIANDKRLLILCLLSMNREMSVTEMVEAVGLGQSALSQHLARLRHDGLVSYRREAQTLFYRISDKRAVQLLKALKKIFC